MRVLTVGGGLAGLTAATALHAHGHEVVVVEARPFVGGRMMTVTPEGLGEAAWFDAGATWHWTDQPRMQALARELGIGVFPQYRDGRAMIETEAVEIPPPDPQELRFVGGAQRVCERLAARLPEGAVVLSTTVMAVEYDGAAVTANVAGPDGRAYDIAADFAIVAVPPRLLVDEVAFTPDLTDELSEVLRGTPTWMATALKSVAVYESPFWREDGKSGLALCRSGPLREVHDAGNDDGNVAGLWAFVAPSHEYRDLSFDDRLDVVFAHLGRLFGPAAADPLRYFERDWSGDPLTNDEVVWVREPLPYGNPAFARAQWDGRLAFAGTETATEGAGHMEGAVMSGHRAADLVLAGAERRA
ncbi:MAG: flavin monoamine oxidase family protein [Acidimicrobiales bacterium]